MIPQRIVAIGASYCFGLGDSTHGGFIGRLKIWHENKDKDNNVYNLGISGKAVGQTTVQILKRLQPEVSIREPDLILLVSGVNDVRRHASRENPCVTSREDFRKNIVEMIHQAKILAEVVVISPIPIREKHDSADNYLLPKDVEEYAQIIQEVCIDEKVAYLDMYHELAQQEYTQLLTSDGVHPNEKGHEKIFEKLKELLEKIYQ